MVDKEKVQEVLNAVRPSLQADGGDVELIDVSDDGIVTVELQGACKGCPMSQMTLANGIERILILPIWKSIWSGAPVRRRSIVERGDERHERMLGGERLR